MVDRRSLLHRLDALAQAQHGVFAVSQVVGIGFSRRAVQRRIASGEWVAVYPKVLRRAAAPLTWEGRLMAAVLWGDEGSAVSHRTAASLQGLFGSWGIDVEITTPRRQSVKDLTIHHSARPIPSVIVENIPVTPVDRTILDLCGTVHRVRAAAVMDDALRRGLTDLSTLYARLKSEERSGRPGIAIFRDLVEERDGKGITDSDLEDMFADLAAKHLWNCVHHHVVRGADAFVAEMDFAFLAEKLNVETDGYDPHRGLDSFERDRERDAQLQLMGWMVLRFTWRQLKERPGWVVAHVEEALELRRAA